ncbi:MAG TPA: Arc family DNA-binding protein [Thermoanaerobaculia bacterium]|nr:Arc family DNA-binding protein [Thermoanaerobaculia bacterium]
MPVDLSIKRVPDDLAERLRHRAARHHRSLQGELMAMLEEHVARDEPLTLRQAHELARAAGLRTPAESAAMIRADRDANGRGEREQS